MTETTPQAVSTVPRVVPDFETNWQKTKELLPFWGWKEETLDALNLCWQSVPVIEDRLARLGKSIALPNLPPQEVKVANARWQKSTAQLDKFCQGLDLISNSVPNDIKWTDIKELAEVAEELNGTAIGSDEQATALLEEINELQTTEKLPSNYEQLVAQDAIKELLQTMQFDMLEYTAADDEDEEFVSERTLQDPIEEEKDEIRSALRKKPWTKAETKGARVGYLALRRLIRNDDNDVPVELQNDVEKLWNKAAKNEGPEREGALNILQLTQDIYITLRDNGALDINLNDLVEEEEEMLEE